MGFMDSVKEESKKYGAGANTDFFNFDGKGVYKVRVLAQPKTIATHFFGKGNPSVVCVGIDEGCIYHKEGEKKPSVKLATYVVDRKDGKVKMAELPLSVGYAMNTLQEDEDFAFTDFPMPYDIKINYDPDNNDPKEIYKVVASPKQENLTKEEKESLSAKVEKQTPEQYVEAKKNRQKEKTVSAGAPEYPSEEINPNDVPF